MSFVDFKEVSNPVTGSTTKYGSQDLLDIMQIFNGKTTSNKRPRIINQWRWDSNFDMKEIAGPALIPAAGYQSLFIDSADHHIKRKNSSGTITDLEAGAGGGGNVSTGSPNTYGDFDQIFRSTRLKLTNPANTFNYAFAGSAITASRTITLPLLTTNDNLVCEAFAQTLTNKTFTAPVISNYEDYTRISIPSNPLSNFARVYCKQIDTNNDGLFVLVKKAGAYAEVQVA